MRNILQKITIISACLGLAFFIFAPGVRAAGCCSFYDITCTGTDCTESYEGPSVTGLFSLPQQVYQKFANPEETYEIACVDAVSYNDCNNKAQDRDQRAMWWYYNCTEIMGCVDTTLNPYLKDPYQPTNITPISIAEPTNPVCWPQAECESVCKTGNCWTGQADECSPGRGYCLADQTDIELGVNIAGVGRVSDFGSYIALLYNYLIGVIVIVAVVMMMYGGFRWITAGGGPQIGEAKKTIASAVIGLLLGLFSYTILNIVNPATLELELPRIKRIRPVYYQVDKVRCEDYDNPAECKANPNNFSITYNEEGESSGGCVWTEIGFGKKCVSQDFTKGTGYPGNLCLSGNQCSEGKCVKYENVLDTYKMNPLATKGVSLDQTLNWCTNGAMDMPCKYDTDCKLGLKCDERLWACVGTKADRPEGAECENDQQCASAYCNNGVCLSGRGGTVCIDGDECNENLGYKCVKFNEAAGFCCDLASAQKQGHGCYTGCTSDSQCGDDMYCWRENATLVEEGGEATEQRPIAEWNGVCFEKAGSGDYCFFDSGCESGLSCSSYQSLSPADSAHISLFRAPGSESSPIILPPGFDRIRVGRCQ